MKLGSPSGRVAAAAAVALVCALASPARADAINLGQAANYAVLYQGAGGHARQITSVTINVGGAGHATDCGPSTINGRIDFFAASTGQFSNNNVSNGFAVLAHFGVSAVGSGAGSALMRVNSLSQTLSGMSGTAVAINGIQTVDASSGVLQTINGRSFRAFNVTSFDKNGAGGAITFDRSATDHVAFNLGGLGNIQFHGGIGADSVVFNVGGGNYATFTGGASLDINNGGREAGFVLDPNGTMNVTSAVAPGRIFAGDSIDMQVASGSTFTAAGVVPLPSAALSAVALLGLLGVASAVRRRRASLVDV